MTKYIDLPMDEKHQSRDITNYGALLEELSMKHKIPYVRTHQLKKEVQSLLVTITEGTPWVIVDGCPMKGFEAWRRLHYRGNMHVLSPHCYHNKYDLNK